MRTLKLLFLMTNFVLLTFAFQIRCIAQQDTHEKPAGSIADSSKNIALSDEQLKEKLIEVGSEIAELILDKNAMGLLKYVRKSESSVSYFPDVYKSRDDVYADLMDTTSKKYCQIFDITCYPGSDLKASVYDVLFEGKTKDMRIEAFVYHDETDSNYVYGALMYEWEGMPEIYKKEPLSTNYFTWTKEGWMFSTFFSWY